MMTDEKIKLLEESPVEAAYLLRADFAEFIRVFHWYTKKEQFVFKDFHKTIIKELESIVYDKPHNLIISIPVRFGKSVILRYFIAWTYSINRNCNNIYTSYSDDLVRQFSGEIRDLINSPLYKKLFGIQIKEDTANKGLWQIENGGSMRACSMGGAITGFGAGISNSVRFGGAIFEDDPLKADDARSAVAKQHCIDYHTETLCSRKNNEHTPIIIIAQRLAVDDIVGYLKKNSTDFKVIEIPALNENNESIWPERFSTESLLKIQREQPYYFAAQYMQNPILVGGNVIHVDKFRTYKELPDNILYTKVFCDFAMTAKTHSDYSVFLLCGFTQDKKMYVIDMWRNRWEVPDLTKFALTLWKSFKNATNLPYPVPRCMCIEQKASGIGVLQEFKKQGIYVEPLYPTAKGADGKEFVADKFQRVCDILPEIEVGNVYIPDKSLNKVWLDYFLKELREFTADDTHQFDDACFTEDTKIATIFGDKKIKDIRIGDWLITPLGLSKVTDCGITGYKEVISKFGLEATPNHKVFNLDNSKFDKLGQIKVKQIEKLNLRSLLKWKILQLYFLITKNFSLIKRQDITLIVPEGGAKESLKDYMLRFGNIIAEEVYPKGMKYITRILIRIITTLIIWNVYLLTNTIKNILKKLESYGKQNICKMLLEKAEKNVKNGTKAKNEKNGILNIKKNIYKKLLLKKFAKNAEKNLTHSQIKDIKYSVENVETNFLKENLGKEKKKIVYNITTEVGCYYANGILVSNCDCLVYATKELIKPRMYATF